METHEVTLIANGKLLFLAEPLSKRLTLEAVVALQSCVRANAGIGVIHALILLGCSNPRFLVRSD